MTAGTGAPSLTPKQRADALLKATEVRSARRAFKDAVARGDYGLGPALALARANEALAGIRVVDLLVCLPGVGPKRAEALMSEARIAPSRRVRGLGQRQMAALTETGTR